jgi:hypothetical protein
VVSPETTEYLKQLRTRCTTGVVGGSDLAKQMEQLGDTPSLMDYCFPENGLLAIHNGKEIGKTSFLQHLGEANYTRLVNFCLNYMSKIDIPQKRGTFVEFRNGMINVSPIGRNCNREERNACVALVVVPLAVGVQQAACLPACLSVCYACMPVCLSVCLPACCLRSCDHCTTHDPHDCATHCATRSLWTDLRLTAFLQVREVLHRAQHPQGHAGRHHQRVRGPGPGGLHWWADLHGRLPQGLGQDVRFVCRVRCQTCCLVNG